MLVSHLRNDELIEHPREFKGPVKELMRLTATAGLFRATDGCFYAKVSAGRRRETLMIRSAAFRDWLIDGYYRACGDLASDWAIRRVRGALEAIARYEGGTPSIFVRIGHDGQDDGGGGGSDNADGSACYLDLADPDGRAVKIGPEGWSIVEEPDIHFRRPDGHLALPIPARDGSIDLLRPYVNLSDRDFRLLVVWMAAALRPVGPYPIMALYGQHGSTKSTLARIVRRLIDPQVKPLLAQPGNMRDLMISAVNGWLLAYDNVSVLPQWLSDGLCMLSTGGALAGHASFTTGERSVIHAQRPVILNGMEEYVQRSDLSDRCIFLNLSPIDPGDRRCEIEFWKSFHHDYPRILGGLLDAVVGGLQELPSVNLTELPRMADFAKFAEAVGRKLGWPAGTALSNYNDNRRDASMTEIGDSALAAFLLDLGPDYLRDWSGTASKLHQELTMLAGEKAESPDWPKSSQHFGIELRRIAPQLGDHGLLVNFSRSHRGRTVSIKRIRAILQKSVDTV
jgi:hypothetical protein